MKFFGTDGVRGKYGEFLTNKLAFRIGRFISQYPNNQSNLILIAQDTRESGPLLKEALIEGLLLSGGRYVDLGISTTPSLSYLVHKYQFDYAIMISASHNPYYDNGIKIFDKDGKKLSSDVEELIEAYILKEEDDLPIIKNSSKQVSLDPKLLLDEYLEFLISTVNHDLSKLKVLVDCANGSASYLAPILFNKLNINATFINNEPNGVNINKNCGSTYLDILKEHCKKDEYDLCLAFDGDADRVLFMKNEEVLDGDHMLFLLAKELRKEKKLKEDTIVITQMANFGLRKALKDNHIQYLEVEVGDKYVQAALEEHNLLLGGEQSGHIIFYDYLNTGDGLLTALKVFDAYVNNDYTFNNLLKDLKIYPQTLKNIAVSNKNIILKDEKFKSLIAQEEKRLGDQGRLLIRPSGTEPLIRIMVEAQTHEECLKYSQVFEDYINKNY